jgi:hypothetical protein
MIITGPHANQRYPYEKHFITETILSNNMDSVLSRGFIQPQQTDQNKR